MAARKALQIVPSLLAADLGRLGEQIEQARAAGVTWVSVDVMDGHFVPNLSFGPDFVRLAKRAGMTVDSHLMVANPEAVYPWFAQAGADIVTVHLEACREPGKVLKAIRAAGAKAGLAVKPKTPAGPLIELLGEMDLALIMMVEPGFGGAKFMDAMLPKIEAVRRAIDQGGFNCWLQADGGINSATIQAAALAGADSLVAGSAVFGSKDPGAAIRQLRERATISVKQ